MAYYNESELQPVHAADAWNLDRYLFTAVAYLARAGKKEGSAYEDDVLKAMWFLAYAVSKDTDCAVNVIDVMRLSQRLAQGDDDENKKATRRQLSVHVRSANDTGNVDSYTVEGQQTESELVREKCDNALSDVPFADRVSQWLKGAIE